MILLSTTSLFLIKSISFLIYLSIWILSSNKEIQCQNTERVSRAHDSFKQKDKNLECIMDFIVIWPRTMSIINTTES